MKIKFCFLFVFLYLNLFSQNNMDWKLKYDNVEDIYFAYKVTKNQIQGVTDKQGNIIVPVQYKKVIQMTKENLFVLSNENGKEGLIDINQKVILTFIYDELSINNDLILAKKGNKYGFFTLKGEIVSDFIYDNAILCHYNLALVAQNNKMGYINSKGKTIIPLEYDYNSFTYDKQIQEGKFFILKKNNQTGVVGKNNQITVPFIYSDISPIYNDMLLVVLDTSLKYSVINVNGKVIIEPQFIAFYDVREGALIMQKTIYGKKGCIDISGKELIPFIYDELNFLNPNFIKIRQQNKLGVLNLKNVFVVPLEEYENIILIDDRYFEVIKHDGTKNTIKIPIKE